MQRSSQPGKRKAPLGGVLNRRVRARKDEPEPQDVYSESQSDASDDDDEGGPQEMTSSKRRRLEDYSGSEDEELDSQQEEVEDEDEDSDDESESEPPLGAAAQVSFGALAKAQASLPSTRKKKNKTKNQGDDGSDSDSSDDDDDQDDQQRPPRSKEEETKSRRPSVPSRAHKHAPTEQSSKRAVTRKREVVSQTVVKPRDPRFDPAAGGPVDEDRFRKRYGFLDSYRDDELAAMKRTLREATAAAKPGASARKNKKLKNAPVMSEHEREQLKREIASIESRKAAQAAKDRQRELLDEHRKREKELVKQGKTPFYLKKAEQKKQLLVDRFSGMKKKQVDRAIERKRKKVVAKERRDMPWARRTATSS